MPAIRKSIVALTLSGTAADHPGRIARRQQEPPAVGTVGTPPGWLSAEEAAVWLEVAGELPPRTAGLESRQALAELAVLLTGFRSEKTRMKPALVSQMLSLQARLGLSAVDRQKLQAAARPPDDSESHLASALRALDE